MLGLAAGCEQPCLHDPVFALDPSGKANVMADPDRLLGSPVRDLPKLADPEPVAGLLNVGPHALDPFEIIGFALRWRRNARRPAVGMKRGGLRRCGGNVRSLRRLAFRGCG